MTTKWLRNQVHRPKDTGEYERADITSFWPATLFLSPTPQSPLNLPEPLPSRINEDKEQEVQYDPLPTPGAYSQPDPGSASAREGGVTPAATWAQGCPTLLTQCQAWAP